MTATKSSRTGVLALAGLLGVSLCLSVYQLTGPAPGATDALMSVANAAKARPAAAPSVAGIPTLDFAMDADLPTLRDALRAAGASDTRIRQIFYGVLERRMRDALTQKRLARSDRGWWKDETRTLGVTRANQSYRVDVSYMKTMVDDPIEKLLGLDPTQVDVVNARYSFMPEEKRFQLARIERELLLPGQWSPTGDPEADAKTEAEYKTLTKDKQAEKDALLASLTPDERREYEMHYGQLATRLQNDFRSVAGTTDAEYRKLYRIVEDQTAAATPGESGLVGLRATAAGSGVAIAVSRAPTPETSQRIVDQVFSELGYDRAMEYVWSSSQEYRGAATAAQQANLPPSTALSFAQLAADTGDKASAIHKDATLSVDQRRAALVALQQDARARLNALIPADAQSKVPASAMTWLNQLSSGGYKIMVPGVPGSRSATGVNTSVASPNPITLPPGMLVSVPARPAAK